MSSLVFRAAEATSEKLGWTSKTDIPSGLQAQIEEAETMVKMIGDVQNGLSKLIIPKTFFGRSEKSKASKFSKVAGIVGSSLAPNDKQPVNVPTVSEDLKTVTEALNKTATDEQALADNFQQKVAQRLKNATEDFVVNFAREKKNVGKRRTEMDYWKNNPSKAKSKEREELAVRNYEQAEASLNDVLQRLPVIRAAVQETLGTFCELMTNHHEKLSETFRMALQTIQPVQEPHDFVDVEFSTAESTIE